MTSKVLENYDKLLEEAIDRLDKISTEEFEQMCIDAGFNPKRLPDEILSSTDRRYGLGNRMNEQKLKCPECSTRQVQLVGYIDIKPAEWRCRKCKTYFNWEGE